MRSDKTIHKAEERNREEVVGSVRVLLHSFSFHPVLQTSIPILLPVLILSCIHRNIEGVRLSKPGYRTTSRLPVPRSETFNNLVARRLADDLVVGDYCGR